jgi:transcriptional regulator with GAF, ATPase, and Fis domain
MTRPRITLDELLPFVISRTNDILQAESCALALLDEHSQELFFPVTTDLSPHIAEYLKRTHFPADQGIAGWVLKNEQAICVPDVSQDPRFLTAIDAQTGARTQQLLCVPLRTKRGTIGVIQLRNKRSGVFTETDLDFLEVLAGPIAVSIENARLYQQVCQSEASLKEEVALLRRERLHQQRFSEIIGNGPAMSEVFSLMESAIPTAISVLLCGETGTGKERIAQAIHAYGPRKDAACIVVNCGALQETLLESELFGHKKGAFTGAVTDKLGLFEVADKRTIFLDEIGETSFAMQVKLLRVLQEGEIRRLGDTHARHVDVRVIAATNRDLAEDVRHKRFREDLYYRLNTFPICVPALRAQREDIPLLASHFLHRSEKRQHKSIAKLTPDALEALVAYPWPGNVPELENEMERAVALTPHTAPLTTQVLSEKVTAHSSLRVVLPTESCCLKQARLTFEREYIATILQQHQGNAVQTAKALGLSRQMLQKKIKDYSLRFRQPPT